MNPPIPREAYLAYARNFTDKEKRLIDEFSEWLPDEIIDCHAHCNLPEHVISVSDRTYHHLLSTFTSFSLEESKAWQALLHPGKKIRTLRFPKTFRGLDHRAANSYLLKESPREDCVALYGLPDDPDYSIGMFMHPNVSALKMYYSYLEPPATEIYQYFTKVILAAAEVAQIPIILHPPARITWCLDQVLKLIEDFPRLRICIAHLGMTKSLIPGLEDAYRAIAKHDNINLDTSLVPSAEVVNLALQVFGVNRIMYGSDEPLNLVRSFSYLHPRNGPRLVSEYPYHWADPVEHEEFKSLAVGVTHAHWQALQAIKDAVTRLPLEARQTAKQKIFHDNAKSFYGF